MKVKELIELLETFDQDLEVGRAPDNCCYWGELESTEPDFVFVAKSNGKTFLRIG